MKPKTPQETANEQTIRKLYSLANSATKDTAGFVAMFGEDGYFYDVGAGEKYYDDDIGVTADNYATAFPDMYREFLQLYTTDDLVVVELTLSGTHKGDLELPKGTIPPTARQMRTLCCDVFHLKDGKISSFHCYVAVPILLEQLGVFLNLQASFRR